MRKILLGALLASAVLCGADLQVAGGGAKAVGGDMVSNTNGTVENQNFIDLAKHSKEINFVETKPAQFIFKVPVDLDPLKAGIHLDDNHGVTTGKLSVACFVYDYKDSNFIYSAHAPVTSGNSTVEVKFNNIPFEDIARLTRYVCRLDIQVSNGHWFWSGYIPDSLVEIKNVFLNELF